MDGWMWDKLILELKCQSVRQDLIFLASTTSEVKIIMSMLSRKSFPTNSLKHTFFRMYGLGVMLDMTTPKVHLTIQIVV